MFNLTYFTHNQRKKMLNLQLSQVRLLSTFYNTACIYIRVTVPSERYESPASSPCREEVCVEGWVKYRIQDKLFLSCVKPKVNADLL